MNDNPYQSPSADLTPPPGQPGDIGEPRRCAAGRGANWFFEGWNLFKVSPVMLVAMVVLMMIIMGIVGVIPLLGGFLVMLFWPHFSAGIYLALEHGDQGQEVSLGDLFAPFRQPVPLLGVGALYLVGTFVLTMIAGVFLMGSLGMHGVMDAGSMGQAGQVNMAAFGLSTLLGLLIAALFAIPLGMAVLFAPILVFRHGLPAMEAMKLSFRACLRNVMPFLVWGLVWLAAALVLLLLAMIPFVGPILVVLCGLVFAPLNAANIYRAYLDIFAGPHAVNVTSHKIG